MKTTIDEEISRDIREYLERESNLRGEDKFRYIRSIFNKHLGYLDMTHVIGYNEIQNIISSAKYDFANKPFPMTVSGNKISTEAANVCMVDSTIMYLKGNGLLKQSVKIEK